MKKVLLVLIVFIGLFTLSGCLVNPDWNGRYVVYHILEIDHIKYNNENFKYTEIPTIQGAESDYFKSCNTYEKFHETFNDEVFSKYNKEYFLENSVLVLNIREKYKYHYYGPGANSIGICNNSVIVNEKLYIERHMISKEEINENFILIVTIKGKLSSEFDEKFNAIIENGFECINWINEYYIVYDFKQYNLSLDSLEYSKDGKAYMIDSFEELKMVIGNEEILNKYHENTFDYYNYGLIVIPLIESKKYEYQDVTIDKGIITIDRKEVLEENSEAERRTVLIIQSEDIYNRYLEEAQTKYEFLVEIKDM